MGKYICYLLVCIGCLSCSSNPVSDRLLEKDTIDLGGVNSGAKVDFTIGIANPTDHYLKILHVKGNCECVVINKYPTGLSPKQNGAISATYTSQYEKEAAGVLYKNIVIKLDRKPFIHWAKVKVNVK